MHARRMRCAARAWMGGPLAILISRRHSGRLVALAENLSPKQTVETTIAIVALLLLTGTGAQGWFGRTTRGDLFYVGLQGCRGGCWGPLLAWVTTSTVACRTSATPNSHHIFLATLHLSTRLVVSQGTLLLGRARGRWRLHSGGVRGPPLFLLGAGLVGSSGHLVN